MDRLFAILGEAFTAVRAFRLRTLFCVLSVTLGIASITIIVAATEGAYGKAYDLVGQFGSDSLLVLGGGEEQRATGQRQKTLTLDDIEAIGEQMATAYLTVPMTSQRVTVAYRDKKTSSTAIGSTADYNLAWTWPVVQGSDFTEDDVRGLRNVGLIGTFLQKELFGEEDPVGKYIRVNRIPVQIVGVLLERGVTPTGQNMDDRIVMPITTVMRKVMNETTYVNLFRIRFLDQENLDGRIEELRELLRSRHRLAPGEPDDFRIISPREIIKFLVAISGSLVLFLGVVGIISLFVAGFVLANLFLLSVRERTREIGIRRAAGARRRDIRNQFLAEALIITTAGGLAGFFAGYGAARLLTLVADFPIVFSWRAFAAGLVLSWVIGVAFGLQPASRAANLNPIEAIRA